MGQERREYRVDGDHLHRDEGTSTLAQVAPPVAPTPLIDPAGNQAAKDALAAQAANTTTAANPPQLDGAVLGNVDSSLSRGLFDWAVTDEDARSAARSIQGVAPDQQRLLLAELRKSGKLDTLLEELPEEERAKFSEHLESVEAIDKVKVLMDPGKTGWAGTDREAAEAVDLMKKMPLSDRVKALSDMDDATFTKFVQTIPADRYAELQEHYDAATDPARKLELWGLLHQGRAEQQRTSMAEDRTAPGADTGLVDHRNGQRDAITAGTKTEVAEEIAFLKARMAAGETVNLEDVVALDTRKRRELDLEFKYGQNLTNVGTPTGLGPTDPVPDRRVWSMTELDNLAGAFSRMPESHLRDNTALTEIRREDVRRDQDGTTWTEDPDVGADAGGGLIRFYDTGTGFDASTGTNPGNTPWRIGDTSPLAGHEGTQKTSLIEEVLSHEAGHTVHQGDDKLWQDFQAISDWHKLDKAGLRSEMKDAGLGPKGRKSGLRQLEKTRDDGYGDRNTLTKGQRMFEVDPYSDGYLSVNKDAIPQGASWDYARSNPEDHFAEVYTKAIHEPEQLHADLVSGPSAQLTDAESAVAAKQAELDFLRSNKGTPRQVRAAEAALKTANASLTTARSEKDLRQQQWQFFRNDVFKTDDRDIQALTAPAGKEAVYDEYKALAAQCATPQQLAALRQRYAGKL